MGKEYQMPSNQNTLGNVMVTFVIGFVAGVSPFVFMQLLPALLNPGLYATFPNYIPIILTGMLVGAITSILFTTTFQQRQPQEVFFYALGIPAILIATVSNISTEFQATRTINEVQEKTTAAILNPPKTEVIKGALEPATRPTHNSTSGLLSTTAWANENREHSAIIFSENDTYYVVIGEYDNASKAWEAYDKYGNETLRTERYATKALNVFQLDSNRYILVYSSHSTEEDARRVYQLLSVNNPELNAKIIHIQSGGA
jgi:hypothetical protein